MKEDIFIVEGQNSIESSDLISRPRHWDSTYSMTRHQVREIWHVIRQYSSCACCVHIRTVPIETANIASQATGLGMPSIFEATIFLTGQLNWPKHTLLLIANTGRQLG